MGISSEKKIDIMDMRLCKKGDLLISRLANIYEYVEYCEEKAPYGHIIKDRKTGALISRSDNGSVFIESSQKYATDNDIIGWLI